MKKTIKRVGRSAKKTTYQFELKDKSYKGKKIEPVKKAKTLLIKNFKKITINKSFIPKTEIVIHTAVKLIQEFQKADKENTEVIMKPFTNLDKIQVVINYNKSLNNLRKFKP